MKKVTLSLAVACSVLLAGGYKIPETSTNAVALGAANIAHNHENADAAYYNPAKMVFMKDQSNFEADLICIGLDKVKYSGTVNSTGPYIMESKKENFVVPSINYVSPKLGKNDARVGLSISVPGGLSIRWDAQPAKTYAQEFTLEIVEVNPTVAFKVSESIGFSAGFRIVDTKGVVKSSGITGSPAPTTTASRDMKGDSIDYGYNLSFAYKPVSELELGLTYRSKVDLDVEGDAKLNTNFTLIPSSTYSGSASVSIPLPATLTLAAAYTLASKTTVELVYERTNWSAYENLDFDYSTTITNPVLKGAFDDPKPKKWKDTNTFRLGVTQDLKPFTIMAGLVIDEALAPDSTLGFDFPDTDTKSVALGGRYQIDQNFDFAVSALYSMHESRTVKNSTLNGEFTDGDIVMYSAGLGYKF